MKLPNVLRAINGCARLTRLLLIGSAMLVEGCLSSQHPLPTGSPLAPAGMQSSMPRQPSLQPGIDGPLPQPADGTSAIPFVMNIAATQTTADIAAATRAASDAAAQPTQIPGPGRRMDRRGLKVDPASLVRPSSSDSPSQPGIAGDAVTAEPTLTISGELEGPDKRGSPYFPPDTMGDVGPTQYAFAINGRIVIRNKTTGVQDFDLNPEAFFPNSIRLGSYTGDPRVRFDRHDQRWVILYFTTGLPNRIVLAFSDTAVITDATTWTYQSFANTVTASDGMSCFADYPTLGIDRHSLEGLRLFQTTR